MTDKLKIAEIVAGSHLYGYATPESDIDTRYVFLHTDINYVIGLGRYEHQDGIKDGRDEFGWEFRHFITLLRKMNTNVLELVYAPRNEFVVLSDTFEFIRDNHHDLCDSEQLSKCIKGYIFNERRLVLGDRTGLLGSKRKLALEKYGYSPKNAANFLRLCESAIVFYKYGYFPAKLINDSYIENVPLMIDIRKNPGNYTKTEIINLLDDAEFRSTEAFVKRQVHYKFDEEVANDIIYEAYEPMLEKYGNNR